jgi:hypothetical protein
MTPDQQAKGLKDIGFYGKLIARILTLILINHVLKALQNSFVVADDILKENLVSSDWREVFDFANTR